MDNFHSLRISVPRQFNQSERQEEAKASPALPTESLSPTRCGNLNDGDQNGAGLKSPLTHPT
jgi:hypothetical protein